jgi:hypothetical protein
MTEKPDVWFPAKTYGWGWGPPKDWRGWTVLAVFFALVAASVALFPPTRSPGAFLVSNAALAFALTGVCWLKGEKPKWRWGRDGKD